MTSNPRKSSLTRSLSTVRYNLPIEIHPEIFMQLVSLSSDFFSQSYDSGQDSQEVFFGDVLVVLSITETNH